MRHLLLSATLLAACAAEDEPAADTTPADTAAADTADTTAEPPVALTEDLCDDPSLMADLMDALSSGGDSPSYGTVNIAQAQKMMAAPTAGPFYMVNLIRFREHAEYPDGRETDLTGREANDLYAPTEFLEAIGARIVFVGDVAWTTAGEEGTWEQIAIVEYPCPLALFAMSAHPEFQERSVHKDAGVEATIVMVTHLEAIDEAAPDDSPYPTTDDDPDFEQVQVMRYRDAADYGDGSNEEPRTGAEAMALYADSIDAARQRMGVSARARLAVEGVFIGDGREWDAVWIDHFPSTAAYNALAAEPEVVDAGHHHDAAVEERYGLASRPLFSVVPEASE